MRIPASNIGEGDIIRLDEGTFLVEHVRAVDDEGYAAIYARAVGKDKPTRVFYPYHNQGIKVLGTVEDAQ